MKQRSTTPVSTSLTARASAVAAVVLVASAGILQFSPSVFARDYDAEIKVKEQEMQRYSTEAGRLGDVAETLQGALDELNSQIASIQAQISASEKKRKTLEAQIEKNNQTIKQNKKTLGRILSDVYVDDQITPLEMLASSNSIGDYIDKQEQRTSLRTSLNDKIKNIRTLQKKLEEDKKAVEQVIKEQEGSRAMLAGKQAEQSKLVSDTRNDEAAYQKLATSKRAEADSLRQQQIEANLRALNPPGGGGLGAIPPPSGSNGGYPAQWANAPINASVDNWGMYTRQCTSYVAWKLGAKMPAWGKTDYADAKNWPNLAIKYDVSNGSTPRVGAAAVSISGPYGHVMYVEAVNGDGSITVSDYNLRVDGLHRNYSRSSSGLTYIYF